MFIKSMNIIESYKFSLSVKISIMTAKLFVQINFVDENLYEYVVMSFIKIRYNVCKTSNFHIQTKFIVEIHLLQVGKYFYLFKLLQI